MVDATVAVDAIRLVDEDRNDSYGPPEENLGRIAAMWSGYIGKEITAQDVAFADQLNSAYATDYFVPGKVLGQVALTLNTTAPCKNAACTK